MTPGAFRLLRALSSGRPLNGARHAAELGVSRSAVWKLARQLRDAGLPVEARPGGGYRLAWPIELLDPEGIRAALADSTATVEVVERVDSTNVALAERFAHRHALIAECQRAGRGRRGRGWHSPPASGIWLSFGYRFECGLPRLGALSLIAGIAAVDAVEESCASLVARVGLKWPNDLIVDARKLGGILVEIRGPVDGPCEVVVGVGINVRLPARDGRVPDQPWTDLHRVAGHVERSRLAGMLVRHLDRACDLFEARGFQPFAARWQALDALAGRSVRVHRADGTEIRGRAEGVTRRGELRVTGPDGQRVRLGSGEVSVRAA